jgi:hypothetical protein
VLQHGASIDGHGYAHARMPRGANAEVATCRGKRVFFFKKIPAAMAAY